MSSDPPFALRRLENVHVVFWLAKDYSWCTSTKWLGLLMVAPTLGLAVHLVFATRKSAVDLAHNLATVLWILANIVWMIGEFYFDDGTRGIARVFFWCGLATLAVYYGQAAVRSCAARLRGAF